MRLIDADVLVLHLANWTLSADVEEREVIEEAIRAVEESPTQTRRGHWVDRKHFWTCSECRKDTLNLFRYCPYCGAKMDEEE